MSSLYNPLNRRLVFRFLGLAVLLAALVPITSVLGDFFADRVNSDEGTIRVHRVEATKKAVQGQLTLLLDTMETEARRLAENPVVQQVLADPTSRTPTLVRPVLEAITRVDGPYGRNALEAVELYRPNGALFAWAGFEAPLDRISLRGGIPDTLRTAVVFDTASRRTITLWLPVRRGDQVVGAVRVMHRAQVSVPVRNEFIQDYSLADEWRRAGLQSFSIQFSDRASRGEGAPLIGLDGTVLGRISVVPPTEADLDGQIVRLTNGVIAFWIVLLVGWLLAGFYVVFEASLKRAMTSVDRNRWSQSASLLVAWSLALWGVRYGLLALEVPSRWLAGWKPGAALFDPRYLASSVGGGLLSSASELIVTVAFSAAFAIVILRFALFRTAASVGTQRLRPTPARVFVASFLSGLGIVGILAYFVGARHAVLDATLGYFERSGPIPDRVTLIVLMALMAGAWATIAFAASCGLLARSILGWTKPARDSSWRVLLGMVGVVLAMVAITNTPGGTPWWLPLTLFVLCGVAAALFLSGHPDRWAWPISLRGMLVCVLVIVPLTYVVLSEADRERENILIEGAAEDFARGQDPRAVFAIEQVLTEARSHQLETELIDVVRVAAAALPPIGDMLVSDSLTSGMPELDSLAAALELEEEETSDSARIALDDFISRLVAGSLLASLADYTVNLAVLNPAGDTLAASLGPMLPESGPLQRLRVRKNDPLSFDSLASRYQIDERTGPQVFRAPVGSQRGTYRYAGISPVQTPTDSLAGWLYAEASPRLSRPVGETPYPSVLVPARLLGDETAQMSYSEYDNGVLVRSRGFAPGPFQLDVNVQNAFAGTQTEFWRNEKIEGQPYRAYYQRIAAGEKQDRLDAIAVRLPSPAPLDHLFYLLRMTVAALLLGLLVHVGGIPVRQGAGIISAGRTQFADKVLSRFLLVGIATVVVTGIIGRQVIVAQNEQSVENLLRLRLQRVEAAVTAEAGPGIPVAAALERARAEEASAQLGVDLHVYKGYQLVSTSRPQLLRQRFIDERLPADVYQALYAEGRRYIFTEGRIGSFTYTIGYKAIADELGRIIGAVAVPTLPEQASIEAGQARMIAYLFGVLLLLLLGIFITTALLADQLTRPFRRLREGLKAVGEGQTYEPIPVETTDEMGQLAESFNEMQAQLVESRNQLAQQEREMAWREMAQQVAHEIKNPLTPMKLSVQHLRRSYQLPGENAAPEERKFARSLDRITATLIEQIEALSRIAGEFSSFARLPHRKPERLDLNEVIREAAALFDDEVPAQRVVEMDLELADSPLIIEADREELRRAYINLFTNALQAMPEDREGRILVRSEASDGYAISVIQDNGMGIPADVRAHIFQPNFSTKTSGMGLGLAIVKKAVEEGGGTISFETEEGKGSRFRIRTPLARVTEQLYAEAKERP